MSLKIRGFLLASIKIFPRLMTSSRWGQSTYRNETQPKPRPKRLPSTAWVVFSPIVYGFRSISFVNYHTFDCQNISPPMYMYLHIYIYDDNLSENRGSRKPPSRYSWNLKFGLLLTWASSRSCTKFQVPAVILTPIF